MIFNIKEFSNRMKMNSNKKPEIKNSFNLLLVFCFFFITCIASTFAQTGSISGKITDAGNNDVLIGANVLILGTTTGASSDLDGFFSIRNLEPGNYSLRVSYISYQTLTIENIIVRAGQNTEFKIALNSAATELEEVVVTAEALSNTEASVLRIVQKSEGIVDGVSSELISRNNSSDGADVLRRMTGVTIAEGKYSYIRGVSDRYNNTLLNGASLPSTDPEKKSFSYDIFPASLIENIITAKTFTPDKPADFSGGLVQISTIEFPSRFTLDVSTSASYDGGTTGNPFTSYSGGSKDFLGFDDGTRRLPSAIGDERIVRSNFTQSEMAELGRAFPNNWNILSSSAPINGSVKVSLGDKLFIGDDMLGYVGSFTYSNSYENKEIEQSSYTFEGPRYNYKGNIFSRSVVLSGLLNFSYKFGGTNKISFKNVFNQNAEDAVTQYEGFYRYADQFRQNTAIRYISRSLLSNQLMGEHLLPVFNGLNVEWNLSYARSERNEPDARRYIYQRGMDEPDEPLRFLLDQSLTTRYFGELDDNNYGASTDFTLRLFEDPDMPRFKFGYNFDMKKRDFNARLFGFRNVPGGNFLEKDSILQGPVEGIFRDENFRPNFIEVVEITKPSDSYDSDQTIHAGYLLTDFRLFEKIRVVTGVRYEESKQILNSMADTGDDADVNEKYYDFLPAVNLTYSPVEKMNLRLAFSKTLARPEFRELASFTYFDFVANELVIGNPNLKRSLINNYDVRYEYYPSAGEIFALGLFYKRFIDPIEQVLIASSSFEPMRSYRNASSAETYGIEFEARKNFGFVGETFRELSAVGNVTLMKSKIKLGQATSNGNGNGSTFQASERAMQGQAEYILNFGLYYDNEDLGINTSLIYNKVGLQIVKVGFGSIGDIVEKPRDLLDFSISKKFLRNFSLKLTIKDILNQDKIHIQRTPDGDRVSELARFGTSYSIGLSYSL